jgi:hypothetical protein
MHFGHLAGDAVATDRKNAKEIIIMQTVNFMNPAGNVAQYSVYDANSRGEYHWSTDHGDSGFEMSSAQAQIGARMALKTSMAARGRMDQTTRYRSVAKWLQRPAKRPMPLTVKCAEAPSPRVQSGGSSTDSIRWEKSALRGS